MGRKAKLKAKRREERQLLEKHPHRRCGFVNSTKQDNTGMPVRCARAGRWKIITEEGDQTYNASTLQQDNSAGGTIYACNWHKALFQANGRPMQRIA